jgi:hypothetical protein
LKYVINSSPNADHPNPLHGSRIYWRAKSQRHTKIFCRRILIKNQSAAGNCFVATRVHGAEILLESGVKLPS